MLVDDIPARRQWKCLVIHNSKLMYRYVSIDVPILKHFHNRTGTCISVPAGEMHFFNGHQYQYTAMT